MGKATGMNKNLSGKIGTMVYCQRKDGSTVVYEAREPKKVPTRSEAQMRVRMQWSNLSAVYKQFRDTLKNGFENLEDGMSDYNAFVQANVGVCKVYIPKAVRLNGGCVLAPYLVTRGSLPSVSMARNASDVLVSDINLGPLTVDQNTTVGELSVAILAYNPMWKVGDQLTFFYGTQTVDTVTHTPRAQVKGWKVVLDVADNTELWNLVSPIGFSTVDGHLGMSLPASNAAAVWIHSRQDDSELLVSTQYLYVDSAILEHYQTEAAFQISANSYGGINTEEAFLDPRTSVRDNNDTESVVVPTGGGSSSSNGSGSGGSGSGSGSQTSTVTAPTFSGGVPFTETTQVTMNAGEGASIFYTTDGSTPSEASTQYTEPITLSETTTVSAIAVKDGVASSVSTRTFTKGDGSSSDND